MALPEQALQAMKVRLKSVSSEGHFTIYLPSHCSGVTKLCNMALAAQPLEAVQVRLTFSNEGHLTLENKPFIVPIAPRNAVA
jgi:hypothetical protein